MRPPSQAILLFLVFALSATIAAARKPPSPGASPTKPAEVSDLDAAAGERTKDPERDWMIDALPWGLFHLPYPWPEPVADPLSPEQLMRFEDPNLRRPEFRALRLDDPRPDGPGPSPMLAISGLDEGSTVNLGWQRAYASVEREIGLHNVGDALLRISRIYIGSNSLSARPGQGEVDEAGWLLPMTVLEAGESTTLGLRMMMLANEFEQGAARGFFVQVFSNDPRTKRFDPFDELSHEVRLRVIAGIGPPEEPATPTAVVQAPSTAQVR